VAEVNFFMGSILFSQGGMRNAVYPPTMPVCLLRRDVARRFGDDILLQGRFGVTVCNT